MNNRVPDPISKPDLPSLAFGAVDLKEKVYHIEQYYLIEAIRMFRSVQSASDYLGIKRTTFIEKCRKYNIIYQPLLGRESNRRSPGCDDKVLSFDDRVGMKQKLWGNCEDTT